MALIFDFNNMLPLTPTSPLPMTYTNSNNKMTSVTFSDPLSHTIDKTTAESKSFVQQVANLSLTEECDIVEAEDGTLTTATCTAKALLGDVERQAINTFATPVVNDNALLAATVNVLTPSPSTASGRVTASPTKVTQSQVTCSICTKQFDRREHRPKLLDCIHTVCHLCLEDYNLRNPAPPVSQQQQQPQTTCPICMRNTPTSVDKLPLDVATMAMSENLTLFSRHTCSMCEASSEPVGEQEATPLHWDAPCGIIVCQSCYDVHVRESAPNVHKPGSLIAVPPRISDEFYRQIRDMRNAPCPLHSAEMLNQYCYECNSFVCPDCVSDHQRHHLVREQLDFSAQFTVESEFYRLYIENLKPFLRNLDHMWPILEERNNQLNQFADNYDQRTQDLFNHIFERLNQYKMQTLEAVQQIRDERESQLRQEGERLQSLIHTGDRLIQWMMQSIDFCNTVELAAARQFVTNAYQQLFTGLDGFSQSSTMPTDVVQLPRLELFESAVLNILASAENAPTAYPVAPTATSPHTAVEPTATVDEHLPFPQQQPRRALGSTGDASQNRTPATSVLPSRYQGAAHHQLVPFANQHPAASMMGPRATIGNVFFGTDMPSPSATSPSPMTTTSTVPLTPCGTGTSTSLLSTNMVVPSPNNQPQSVIVREPAVGHRIPRQRMIYHLKFGEFGVMEGQFTEPSGIACNAQNDIIVADTNNHRVQIFDSEGRFKFTYGECGKRDAQLLYPNRVAVCKATGDIVVTERSPSHQVQIYDQYGIFVRRFGQDCLKHPRGVFVDSRGRILVVECKVMRVTIFSMEGRVIRSFTCRSYLEFPNGICATDNPEEIYISDNRAHCVWVFNYEGIFLRRIGGEGITNYPIGVGINQLGEIVVADNHNNFNLTAFTPEGQVLYGLESKVKHAQVFDATLMNDGCVAIACKDYRVYVYRYMSASTRHLGLNIR